MISVILLEPEPEPMSSHVEPSLEYCHAFSVELYLRLGVLPSGSDAATIVTLELLPALPSVNVEPLSLNA